MNKNAAILDCTLRDGGFINNWRFGKVCIADILSNLSLSKVDIIEIGYLREDAKKSIHTTEYSKISQIDEIINNCDLIVSLVKHDQFLARKSDVLSSNSKLLDFCGLNE